MTSSRAVGLIYCSHGRQFDLSLYKSIDHFLKDVWDNAFHQPDSGLSTSAQWDLANKAQVMAEMYWRYYRDGLVWENGWKPARKG